MSSCHGRSVLTAVLLAAAACEDPASITDLNSAGPPEVLAVAVPSEGDDPAAPEERATFCRLQENRTPHALCATEVSMVMDTTPGSWKVRIVFDELLDPDRAEELVDTDEDGRPEGHIRGTRPVSLFCGEEIEYDGYYQPTGNAFTEEAGPALMVTPTEFAGTDRECQVSLAAGALADKDGHPLPADQLGPYSFRLSTFRAVATVPSRGARSVPLDVKPRIQFNAPVAPGTGETPIDLRGAIALIDPSGASVETTFRYHRLPSRNDAPGPIDYKQIVVVPSAPLKPGAGYTLRLSPGASITDAKGGALDVGASIGPVSFSTEAGGGQ
jgi:hypothetical protein